MGILNKGSDEINKSLHRSSSASFFNNFFLDFFLILLRISPQSYKILSGFFLTNLLPENVGPTNKTKKAHINIIS